MSDRLIAEIVYLNRCRDGCVVAPGLDDAIANTSTVVGRTTQLSEFAHGDAVWAETVQCVQRMFAAYDIVVTDQAPPAGVAHHEAIVAGSAEELGAGPIKGTAPSVCVIRDNAISFTLAHEHAPDPASLCWTAAQEIAHTFGLEHVYDCRDPMSYLDGCGPKAFLDERLPCGDWSPRPQCYCSSDTHQSSHQWLRQVLGDAFEPPPGAQLGEACAADDECESGLCGRSDGGGMCTSRCDDDAPCPAGFACEATTIGTGACWPVSSGCATATGSGGAELVAPALVILLVLARRLPRARRAWTSHHGSA